MSIVLYSHPNGPRFIEPDEAGYWPAMEKHIQEYQRSLTPEARAARREKARRAYEEQHER